jgi:hypothetical protein
MEPYLEQDDTVDALLALDHGFFSAHIHVADLFWADRPEGQQFLTDLSNEENQ